MRINATLEALSAVKNLTLEELTALLEAVNEKVKSSTDFSQIERDALFFSFADDLIDDCNYYQRQRKAEAARQAENEVLDRKFGFARGDTIHD